MAVAVVLAKFFTFENLYVKCLCVLIVSFLLYEIAYLFSKLFHHLKAKEPKQVRVE
jgi:Sec-independent protein secretion pathway component TatC